MFLRSQFVQLHINAQSCTYVLLKAQAIYLRRIPNYIYIYIYINADLLSPVVAMHACIVLGLHEHDIPTACDVESRR
jgi:hypothetical protein